VLGNPTMNGYPIINQSSTVVDPAWPQERHSSYPGRSLGVSGLALSTALATASGLQEKSAAGIVLRSLGGRPKS